MARKILQDDEITLFDHEEMEALEEENIKLRERISFEQRQKIDFVHLLMQPETKQQEISPESVISYKQDNLFDVDQITRENEEIKQAKHKESNLKARESLNLPYYPNPKDENALMMNYQYEYLMQGKKESWGKLIVLANKVCERMVYGWCAKKNQWLDKTAIQEKASIAMEYVLRRYETNIGYAITTNFIIQLQNGVKHAMLYTTAMEENTVSLDEIVGEVDGQKIT